MVDLKGTNWVVTIALKMVSMMAYWNELRMDELMGMNWAVKMAIPKVRLTEMASLMVLTMACWKELLRGIGKTKDAMKDAKMAFLKGPKMAHESLNTEFP